MITRSEIKAQLLSYFILDVEEDTSTIRYVFVGFRRPFLRQLTSMLSIESSLSIDLIEASTDYGEVIERRAIDKPAILHVSKSRAGEFASLLTFKTLVNEFELPYDRTLSGTAKAYNLYDITSWLFEERHLKKVIKKIIPKIKPDILSAVVTFLRTVWQYAEQKAPGLKYALSPDVLADILYEIQNAKRLNLNSIAEMLGFDPSLKLHAPSEVEKTTRNFVRESDRVRRLLSKGTFLERRRTLARIMENLVRGILVVLKKNPSISNSVGIDKPKELIETFEKTDQRRRKYRVVPRTIQILEYSKYSGIPKTIKFGIQIKTDETYVTSKFFPLTWNDVLSKFAKTEGLSEQLLSFKLNGERIIVTYCYLEGYNFTLRAWKREEL